MIIRVALQEVQRDVPPDKQVVSARSVLNMEGNRFDELTRAFARRTPRRTLLRSILGLGGASLVGSTADARTTRTRPTVPPPPPRTTTPAPTTTTPPGPACIQDGSPCEGGYCNNGVCVECFGILGCDALETCCNGTCISILSVTCCGGTTPCHASQCQGDNCCDVECGTETCCRPAQTCIESGDPFGTKFHCWPPLS